MTSSTFLVFLAVCFLAAISFPASTNAQVMPVWIDDFDTLAYISPSASHYNDYDDYSYGGVSDFSIMAVGDEDEGSMGDEAGGLGMAFGGGGGDAGERGDFGGFEQGQFMQGQFMGRGMKQSRPSITLPMQYIQVQGGAKQPRFLPEEVHREYLDQTTVKPKVISQPMIVKRYTHQPITRVHHMTQPVVRRLVKQKVIRPHVITRTEYRPHIKTQPIIVPRYFDKNQKHEEYRVEHVQATPITLNPTYDNQEVRGPSTYGTLPPKYMPAHQQENWQQEQYQPQQEQYQPQQEQYQPQQQFFQGYEQQPQQQFGQYPGSGPKKGFQNMMR